MGTAQKNLGDFPMDYDSLRQEGIRLIEKLGSQQWTDYNTHDPGITILEQLCYALTDLAYRIDYPIPDLLAEGGRNSFISLFRPSEILPSNPVTLQDIRKIAVDVEGVRNAWIERIEDISPLPPEISVYYFNSEEKTLSLVKEDQIEPVILKGLYQVSIEIEDGKNDNTVENDVVKRLHQYRNIGEDFFTRKLEKKEIRINSEIEIAETADAVKLQREIYKQIRDYFSPPVRFYSLLERIDAGEYMDELFEGPLLEHGFINSEEFEKTNKRRTELRASDLIRLLMDIEGVRLVRYLQFPDGEKWLVKLEGNIAPTIDKTSNLVFIRGDAEIPIKLPVEDGSKSTSISSGNLDNVHQFPFVPSKDRKIGVNYYSVQHQFPDTYGINSSGLPASASPSRKAKAKQLKAYLLLFDQLLANQFAQLANVGSLFSFAEEDADCPTYCYKLLDDPELGLDIQDEENRIWIAPKKQDRLSNLEKIVHCPPEKELYRKNSFLNHLLARFAEQFQDDHPNPLEEQIKCKRMYLQYYATFSKIRGKAINYLNPSIAVDNRTGLEQRIMLKLGITDKDTAPFYLIEHILLRPIHEDRRQKAPSLLYAVNQRDPYSLQISVVLPEGHEKLQKMEQLIREEMPAHLTVRFHKVNKDKFQLFEETYRSWRNAMSEYYGCQRQAVSNTENNKKSPCPYVEIENNQDESVIHYDFRSSRDRIIDLLEIGETYPLSDLSLKYENYIQYGYNCEISINQHQRDATYILCYKDGKELQYDQYSTGLIGDDLIITTPPVTKDTTTYTICAYKNEFSSADKKILLNKSVSVKAGLNLKLEKEIIGKFVRFGDPINVRISTPQAGVAYQLFDSNSIDSIQLSDKISRQIDQEKFIDIKSNNGFCEDKDIFIKAVSSGSAGKNENWLAGTLPVMVWANTELEVAATPSSILAAVTATPTIKISATQSSVSYQAYCHTLSDKEFLFGSSQDKKAAIVPVSNYSEVQIENPLWEEIWKEDTPDYVKITEPVQGNDGTLTISVDSLKEDSLIIIKAEKIHADKVSSSVQLRNPVVFLVPPDSDKKPSLNLLVEDGKACALKVSNGQTGVFYHFSLKEKNQEEVCLPAYFHDENKGIGKLRIEGDFVIASSENYKDITIELFNKLLLHDDITLHIRARKARTNVWIDLKPVKLSDIVKVTVPV